MFHARRLSIALALFALAGCAAVPPARPPADWDAVKVQRQSLDRWKLNGRAAVSAASEGWSASLDWRQDAARSELRLSGPFGTGALRVTIDGESLDIQTGKGERLAGEDARVLLEETLGTSLPLKPLRYWLLGVPEPATPALAQLDDQGRLGQLDQAGWHVSYDRYAQFGGSWLPTRVDVQQSDVKLKLVIDRWNLAP